MKDLTPINADHKPRPIACDDHRDESARTRPAGHDHDAIYEFGPDVGRDMVIIGTTAQPQMLEHDGTGAWCKCGGHADRLQSTRTVGLHHIVSQMLSVCVVQSVIQRDQSCVRPSRGHAVSCESRFLGAAHPG